MKNIIRRIKRKIYKLFHPPLGEILMLHRVTNDRSILAENRILEVTPGFLEATILKYKSQGYRIVSLDDVFEQIILKKKVKGKFVCFTLDDGYKDNYETAYPVFKKYDCPFTIFITTDFPDKKGLLWWYQLENILLKTDKLKLADGSIYACTTAEEKNKTFRTIREKIFSLQPDNMQQTLQKLFGEEFPYDEMNKYSLSWANIKELAREPLCTIASHTVSHPALDALPESCVRAQLEDSKKKLEAAISKPVKYLAYPYGRYNNKVAAMAAEYGYNMAVLANGGLVRERETVFELKRNILVEE